MSTEREDLYPYLSAIVERVTSRPFDREALAREEAARTDPWRWYCRLCGARGEDPDRGVRDRDAREHLETTPCGRHAVTGWSEAGRLLHVWSYPASAAAQRSSSKEGGDVSAEDADAWLFGNDHGGISIGYGWTARQAKGYVLDAIAEAFTDEGLSASAAKRAAYSYHVRLVAGPMPKREAHAARRAWEAEDWETALVHARPHVRRAYGLTAKARVE